MNEQKNNVYINYNGTYLLKGKRKL